ncbi:MAG: carbon monoxide dehydrogenase subunit G [Wenzhouxiangellaceae bacterium]
MRIEGAFQVDAPPEVVWRYITDPAHVGPSLPGCEEIQIITSQLYKATIKVGVGPIKTIFRLDVEILEERFPEFVGSVTRGEEGERASRLTAHNELRLIPHEGGSTEVTYLSEVNVVGRLGKFGFGVMKKIADKLGNEFAVALCERIQQGGTQP